MVGAEESMGAVVGIEEKSDNSSGDYLWWREVIILVFPGVVIILDTSMREKG